jgi:tetratricopeptide (TPR) repeat protein
MADDLKKTGKIPEPSFKLNYATVILLLVIIIPLGYTIWVNLQDVMPNPKLDNGNTQVVPAQPGSATTTIAANNASNSENLVLSLRAVADNPGFESYVSLGLAYYAVDSTYAAIHAWEKALSYNSKSALAYNDIAAAYGALNKFDEEIAACNKALAIDTGYTLAKNNLAWALSQKKATK